MIMMSTTSLLLTSLLLLIPILISFKERLHIAKDLIVAAIRAVIQLVIIGYLLEFVFKLEQVWIVIALIVVIMINAAANTRKRASKIMHHVFLGFVCWNNDRCCPFFRRRSVNRCDKL